MRVLVTGASGRMGRAVVAELVAAGHDVLGLARSADAAAVVERLGAVVLRGDVGDLELLRGAAADADAVVGLAFRNDLVAAGRFDEAVAADAAAVRVMGEALPAGAALTMASGTVGLAQDGVPAIERDRPRPDTFAAARQVADDAALALAERGVRASVVRLAPVNHGPGDTGFVPALIDIARRTGVVGRPGDGAARWPAAHVTDSARLFRLAIEVAPPGTVLHAAAEEGIPLGDIAEALARRLDLPVRSIPDDGIDDHFGFLAWFLRLDSPVSSALTRELTGWVPTGPDLLTDLADGPYATGADDVR